MTAATWMPRWTVALALAAVGGCRSAAVTEVVFNITGEVPGAMGLRVRMVTDNGARADVHSAGDGATPVYFPASIYVRPRASTRRVGAVVWAVDRADNILAHAVTDVCAVVVAGERASLDVALVRGGPSWMPSIADDCRCDPENGAMCPSGIVPDGGVAPDAARDVTGGADSLADVAAATPDAAPDLAADLSPDREPDVAPPPTILVPTALFGFELPTPTGGSVPDWSSPETTVRRDTTVYTQGNASLSFTVPTGGFVTLQSRPFITNELSGVTGTLGMEIFVNELQIDSAYGADMFCDCPSASLNGVYVGHHSVFNARVGMWNYSEIKLPANVLAALSMRNNVCVLKFVHRGTGQFRYDKMGFVK